MSLVDLVDLLTLTGEGLGSLDSTYSLEISLDCNLPWSTRNSVLMSETELSLALVTSVGILLAEVPEEQSLVPSSEVPSVT